jgi:hypothetical protein
VPVADSTSSDDPKYPLPLPLPLASRAKDDSPTALLLCDPLGLRCKGVSEGLVVRLASRDTPRMGRSGNGRSLGFELRAGDAAYRECIDVGV